MKTQLIGSLAGIAATAAMTVAAQAMHERLPRRERYPLPPREIVMELVKEAGVEGELNEEARVTATLLSHFAFGAAAGAVYASIPRPLAMPSVATGVGYAMAVWAGSYLGWLPAAGILRTATEHPTGRNKLMLLAHLVWGAVAGITTDGLERAAASSIAGGELRDRVRR